jgi:hypothetical protein
MPANHKARQQTVRVTLPGSPFVGQEPGLNGLESFAVDNRLVGVLDNDPILLVQAGMFSLCGGGTFFNLPVGDLVVPPVAGPIPVEVTEVNPILEQLANTARPPAFIPTRIKHAPAE